MSKRTVLNTEYKGLLVNMSIPAELHERDGKRFASFGSARPIHCCTPDEVAEFAATTHHYCDLFTEQVLAPLGELAYVRVDDATAEKVFINRAKRLVLVSADGRLAAWRAAPTFESANAFVAGAPIVDAAGQLLSLVTARRGRHYAVSAFEGEGGYFETSESWRVLPAAAAGALLYGEREFTTRAALQQWVRALPPADVSAAAPARPLLRANGAGSPARLQLLAANGRQLAHYYLPQARADRVEYL